MTEQDRFVVVGKLGSAHGVKGWIKVTSYTSSPADILNYQPWYLQQDEIWHEVVYDDAKPQSNHLLVHFEECDDRDYAQSLTNLEIAVRRDQLPEISEDEHYWSDLEGLTVITTEGVELGQVDHLIETGANAVMIVLGDKRRLVPFIREQVIKAVDQEKKVILVDWDPEF